MTQSANPLFECMLQHCRNAPGRIAIQFPDLQLDFSQLNALAEIFAAWLPHAAGIAPAALKGQRIVLQLPKAPLTYGLWLACIRQGAIYTFVDPKNPPERTSSIIKRLQPALVVSTGAMENPYGASIRLDDLENGESIRRMALPLPEIAEVFDTDPVYVMFTSGSTGEPKGAVIPCRGVVNLMAWARGSVIPLAAYRQAGEAKSFAFSNINPLHFDNSVFDLFCGLLNGNTLVPVETGNMPNPAQWVKLLQQAKTQIIFGVPTLFQTLSQLRLLSPEKLPDARLFIFGGEGFPVPALQKFYDDFRQQAALLNVYGPTETSCICSSIEINDASLSVPGIRLPSIGKMHTGYKHCIIDDAGRQVENGEVGELWIGGDNVGLGYFNDPQISAAAFCQNPLQQNYRDIWYKAGDLVSQDSQGFLWFAGRVDNQVKVRGYRIELEEIDAVVERFAGVDRANTVVVSAKGNDMLAVAFSATTQVDAEDLARHCREKLPPYMVPGKFIQMAKLPKNANGKIDRKAIRLALAQ